MNTGLSMRRVGVVDNHPLFTSAVRAVIEAQSDLTFAWSADSPEQTLIRLGSDQPDLLLLDLVFPGEAGFDLLQDVREQFPRIPILIFSALEESAVAERCLRLGANGYLMKRAVATTLLDAMRRVLAGGIYLSEWMSNHMLGRVRETGQPYKPSIDVLTNCEFKVFQLIGQGLTTKQIAGSLYRSIKTIETYRSRIKRKLGLSNATELAQAAMCQLLGAGAGRGKYMEAPRVREPVIGFAAGDTDTPCFPVTGVTQLAIV